MSGLDAPSIALIGAGAMGGALVRGWIEAVRRGGGLTLTVVEPNFDPALERELDATPAGLIFVNLVDFDTLYGHRNDTAGYAANLERFDARLEALLPRLRPGDLLIVTADHGNDPTTPSTDHSREYVPVLLAGAGVPPTSISARARRSPISASRCSTVSTGGSS